MPRSRRAGPSPAQSMRPDYFSSLAQLQAYFEGPRPHLNPRAAPPVPYSPTRAAGAEGGRGKVLVCHDYKGGYCEKDDERGYTLQYWETVDTFIYFAHHRVSCPPAGWIRAAHTHGTKILGTLIFEWDAGREDIVELVSPRPSSSSSSPSSARGGEGSNPFGRLSTRYADYLVSLALERGFEGWLINVEVELGVGKEGERKWQKEHARALVEWVRYLKEEMKRQVAGAEVMWYDAVTKEGKLVWQNRLNDLNLPFFDAADSLFLNYWWRLNEIEETAKLVDRIDPKRRKDVYFGVDIFGRGSYGGGGFETWRAMQAIQAAPFSTTAPPSAPSAPSAPFASPFSPSPATYSRSFSTALFAPGWTVEASSLNQSLTSPSAYAQWLADDTYLWSHGAATPSVAIEAARLAAERKERRGVERARLLAAGLAPSASPLPIQLRQPPPFDYNALEPLPGHGPPRPISAFLPSPRPVPCPDSSFYTNFSAGSGHAFFVEGVKVLDDSQGAGWTDVGFAFPQPSLVFHPALAEDRKKHGVEARMVEDEAWEGPRALRINVTSGDYEGVNWHHFEKVDAPLVPVELPLHGGVVEVDLLVVWKRVDGGRGGVVSPTLQLASSASGSSSSAIFTGRGSKSGYPVGANGGGWRESTHSLSIKLPAEKDKLTSSALFDLTLSLPVGSSVLIGALSIVPSSFTKAALRPVIADFHYSFTAQTLQWDVDFTLPSHPSSPDGSEPPPPFAFPASRPPPPAPSFRFYHLFLERTAPYSVPEVLYLGTTFDREFAISTERLKVLTEGRPANVMVRGVRADGTVGQEEDGGKMSFAVDMEELP